MPELVPTTSLALVVLYTAGSVAAFVAYAWDKRRAVRGGRRVRESTLHALAVAGGWPGAWLGQRLLRHKTRKSGFQLVFWIIGLGHALLLAWLVTTGRI